MKEGYKKTEAGIIPNEWNVKTIGDIFEFKNGLNKEKEFFGKGTKIINYVDVFRNRALDNNIIQGLVEVSEKEKQLFNTKKGDVFFTRTSETVDEIGMTAVLLENINDLVYSGFVLRARPKTEELDLFYKKYCFSEFYTRKEIMRKSSCTTRALTSGTLLKDVLIKIPTIKEQQKIADILSTVDTQIDDTDKFIEKTKELKKGLMQRFLTKGIGHTEFKMTEVGDIPMEWEVKKISDICNVNGGKRLPKGYQLIDDKNKNPYIRVADMHNGGISLEDIKYVPNEAVNSIKNYTISKDDLFISVAGTLGIVGKVPECLDGANLTENADKLCDIKINKDFLMRVLQSDLIQKIIDSEKTSNAQPKLALTRIKEFLIPIPEKEEQEKIANILISVDTQIEDYENKKTKLEELKKGLMQKLLTGKIRVV